MCMQGPCQDPLSILPETPTPVHDIQAWFVPIAIWFAWFTGPREMLPRIRLRACVSPISPIMTMYNYGNYSVHILLHT
ncbi:hypothetical protein GQ53DRAFT_752510 [Thozetella sp. PMI_491]|nr:hypothetical protein GQ53DRAFT_752510 [Thozetella sp. PMI_491]